jgi:excisionase family DNA binding protein
MPEKLLTIKEVGQLLKLPEEEVKHLVDIGEIPAYRIGGTFLRFRKDHIDAIRSEIAEIEESLPQQAHPAPAAGGKKERHPYSELEADIKRKEPVTKQYDYTAAEKLKDFFYFYDFYIISFAIIAALLFIILRA